MPCQVGLFRLTTFRTCTKGSALRPSVVSMCLSGAADAQAGRLFSGTQLESWSRGCRAMHDEAVEIVVQELAMLIAIGSVILRDAAVGSVE